MMVAVEGKFKDGRIELKELPAGIGEARVIVTFLPDSAPERPPQHIYFGMFKGDGVTNEEDFKLAEWRGDPELGDDDAGKVRP